MYLMLVNDVIHGLYPEAVSIGEDVRIYLFESVVLSHTLLVTLF